MVEVSKSNQVNYIIWKTNMFFQAWGFDFMFFPLVRFFKLYFFFLRGQKANFQFKYRGTTLCSHHKYCRSGPFCWMLSGLGNMARFGLPQLCGRPWRPCLLWISSVKKYPHCAHSTQKVRSSQVCQSLMVCLMLTAAKYCQAAPLF